ncbi:MAG: hypothetical protein ACRDSJ_20890 [Rubrobacteraceae bacterium]
MIIKSEFAVIEVELDQSSNGDRLRLKDLETEKAIHLDALEIETLAWIPENELKEFISGYLDPSRNRWRE